MADQILASTRSSSLYRVLTKGEHEKDDYEINIGRSKAPCANELLTLKVGNGEEISGRSFTVDLPKLGSIVNCTLRIKVVGLINLSQYRSSNASPANNTGDDNDIDGLMCSPLPALSLIKMIRLKTHSRTICELTQEGLWALVHSLPAERRRMTLQLMGKGLYESLGGEQDSWGDPYNITHGTTFQGTKTLANQETHLYLPILMDVFESKTGLNTAFLETCSIELEFYETTRAFDAQSKEAGAHTTRSNAGTSYKADLLCLCKSYRDDVYKDVLAQYRQQPSVQALGWKIEKVGSVTKTLTAIGDATTKYHEVDFTLNTSSSALSRAIFVVVSRVSNADMSGRDPDIQAIANVSLGVSAMNRITSVSFSASGRQVFSNATPEEELMSMAGKHFSVPSDETAVVFFHRFADESAVVNGDRMAGALSLAGCSSQTWNIHAQCPRVSDYYGVATSNDVNQTVECSVWSISYSVTSTSSSSGALRNSLSV